MIHEMLDARLRCPLPQNDLSNSCRTVLFREEYGQPLPPPESLSFEEKEIQSKHKNFCAGFATLYTVIAKGTLLGREFSFPFRAILPKGNGPFPFFIYNDFEDGVPNKYLPAEEIIQRGFAVLHVCYRDVTSDDSDFTNGIAACLFPNGERIAPDASGKLAMWAWANSRLLDYAKTLSCLDLARVCVGGHSRLGKTALLTAMTDHRFPYVFANDSGCSGDALTYGKEGEQISDILRNFSYWFCPNYQKYTDHEKLTFDQHMLLASIAPRVVLAGAATEDLWADPVAQYLSCFAASKAWEDLGLKGFIAPNRLPTAGDSFSEGSICYHLRAGRHYLSRTDWNIYMDILQQKFNR